MRFNYSKNYFPNQTKKIRQYTRKMYTELNKVMTDLIDNFEGETDIEFQIYMITNKKETLKKQNNIIDKYENLIMNERASKIKSTSKQEGFKNDKMFKEVN